MTLYTILNVKAKIEFKWDAYHPKDPLFNEDIIMKSYYMSAKFCVGLVLCLKCSQSLLNVIQRAFFGVLQSRYGQGKSKYYKIWIQNNAMCYNLIHVVCILSPNLPTSDNIDG